MSKTYPCKNRKFPTMFGEDYCLGYEMDQCELKQCPGYEPDEGTEDEREYCPSATMGDYGPSCPWNAPGMSVRDFI